MSQAMTMVAWEKWKARVTENDPNIGRPLYFIDSVARLAWRVPSNIQRVVPPNVRH